MYARLRSERLARRWTQTNLAELTGAHSPSAVSRWEAGTRIPRRWHADRLEQLFGLPIGELLTPETNEDPA
jgi:transcriptional regulator with XRE-family HTH domain